MRCRPKTPSRARRGFTLVELLVTTTIMLILVMIGGFLYTNSLKIYRENAGLGEVYQLSMRLNQQFRDYLKNIVPLPQNWIQPFVLNFKPVDSQHATPYGGLYRYGDLGASFKAGARGDAGPPRTTDIDPGYFYTVVPNGAGMDFKLGTYANVEIDRDKHAPPDLLVDPIPFKVFGYPEDFKSAGAAPETRSGRTQKFDRWQGVSPSSQYLPAFYGEPLDLTPDEWLAESYRKAASYGFPRPDYRLKAHADEPQRLAGMDDLSCWFYTESDVFMAPYTQTLDNNNLMLASLKFSRFLAEGHEQTRLSLVRHHTVGWDVRTPTAVREDASYEDLLRAIEITPYSLENGALQARDQDSDYQHLPSDPGMPWVLRCLDVKFTVRNKVNMREFVFVQRIYVDKNLNPKLH